MLVLGASPVTTPERPSRSSSMTRILGVDPVDALGQAAPARVATELDTCPRCSGPLL
jgi:hypothetical protein